MAKTRRRGYPASPSLEQADVKYGRRGNARGKDTTRATGGNPQLPNRPR